MKIGSTKFSSRVTAALALSLFAPAAMAHDMGHVFVAYFVVLAIPTPAVLALVGWKKGFLGLIPLGAVALWLANSGNYAAMYALLLLPYAVLLARTVWKRVQESKRAV